MLSPFSPYIIFGQTRRDKNINNFLKIEKKKEELIFLLLITIPSRDHLLTTTRQNLDKTPIYLRCNTDKTPITFARELTRS